MAAREVAVASLGTVYAIEGGKEAAEQIGQVLAGKWSFATALAFLAWYLRATMRLDAGRYQARDRWLALDAHHLPVHAGDGYFAAFVTYRVALALGWGSIAI